MLARAGGWDAQVLLGDHPGFGWPFNPTHCHRPDRHVPGLRCGYPRPCPFHPETLEERDPVGIVTRVLDREL